MILICLEDSRGKLATIKQIASKGDKKKFSALLILLTFQSTSSRNLNYAVIRSSAIMLMPDYQEMPDYGRRIERLMLSKLLSKLEDSPRSPWTNHSIPRIRAGNILSWVAAQKWFAQFLICTENVTILKKFFKIKFLDCTTSESSADPSNALIIFRSTARNNV